MQYVLYGIGALVLFFLMTRLSVFFMGFFKRGRPAPDLSGKMGKAVRSGQRTLFYFFTPMCGACREMTPVVKKMAKTNRNVFPVDLSRNMAVGRSFGVMATPTVVTVEDGKVRDYMVGPRSSEKLQRAAGG